MFKATLMVSIFSMMMIFCSFAGEVHTVSGRLIDELKLAGNIKKMIVTDREKTIKLANEYRESISCASGEFKIQKITKTQFALKEIVHCEEWVDETEELFICPKIFSPVCGVPAEQVCEDGYSCEKGMAKAVTYGNNCELYQAKALYIHEGECEEGAF